MTDATHLYDVHSIDLERHAVIEASAGTGKTYCIENLVVRLLCEKEIPLDQILLVTFTEKATGDLHARIRANVIKAIAEGTGRKEFLQEALENFDTASIHTIHGFCQRMLRQYAFENGGRFNLDMVTDEALYPMLLRRQQREEWPAEYGDKLESVLKLSGYPGTIDEDGVSAWERRTLDVAKRFSPKAGNVLLPEVDSLGNMDDLNARISKSADALVSVLEVEEGSDLPELVQSFSKLPMPPMTSKACMTKVLVPLVELLRAHTRTPITVIDFKRYADVCKGYRRFDEMGFACLTNGIYENKLDGVGHGITGRIRDLTEMLDGIMKECGITALGEYLVAKTVLRLQRQAEEHKDEHGLMSFDDMLTMMADSIDPDKNPRAPQMLKQLRKRYQYALVDEFQDTDPIQWRIFERIFLGSDDHRLFLIGDPKQAIYGFRGADVHTYVTARMTLLETHDAVLYNLPVNWRSSEGLVNALNKLCGSNAWFATNTNLSGIHFHPVEVPPYEKRRYKTLLDRTGRAPLTVVDLSKPDRSAAIARLWMAKFVSDEIERLLSETKFIFGVEGKVRPLSPGDMCVLVNRRSEASGLEDFLSTKGIPYTFYKQGGVYESIEATSLFFLFNAIREPGNLPAVRAALMTGAFRYAPDELSGSEPLTTDHPVKVLLCKWHELQSARRWPQLFQSIVEESNLIQAETDKGDAQRRICNYRHILQDLLVAADSGNLNFDQLIDVLRDYRSNPGLLPDNADQQRLASEAPKVQIMTIHSSKGLEFPIVFQLGGFTRGPDASYLDYHDPNGQRTYDLVQTAAGKEAWNEERSRENLRLFYVAATRAVCKLYVPKFRPGRMGYAGPVSQFIYSAIEDAFQRSDTHDVRHVDVRGRDLYSSTPVPEYAEPGIEIEAHAPPSRIKVPDPILEEPANFGKRKRVVSSFSSFNVHSNATQGADLLEIAKAFSDDAEHDEHSIASEFDEELPADLLPAGAATGSMLHCIFELIDFRLAQCADAVQLAKQPEFIDVLEHALASFPITSPERMAEFGSKWRDDVAAIVFNTLNCSLFDDGFTLAQLPNEDRINEMEFFFPTSTNPSAEAVESPDGCIMGFIDLIFRRNGRYYVLDWKSNLLKSGYGPEHVEDAMSEAGYHLQYQIYSIALCRWLRAVIPDFDRDVAFGGVFYLFLRGAANGDHESGIFKRCPSSDDLNAWNHDLATRFK